MGKPLMRAGIITQYFRDSKMERDFVNLRLDPSLIDTMIIMSGYCPFRNVLMMSTKLC